MVKQLSYKDASNWAKKNGVKTLGQWHTLCMTNKLPENLPKYPNAVYKNQWKGWSKFLQNGRRPMIAIRKTYEECKDWARKHKIQTAKQWYTLGNRLPAGMPVTPDRFFKEWVSWPDFLGTNRFIGISIIERVIRLVLDCVFNPEAEDHRKQSTTGASGKVYMIDMLYSDIKLIVEYDGEYYHLEKEKTDIFKTQDLQLLGWNVIRVREGKLKKLNETWDVHIKKCKYEEDKVKMVLSHIKLLSNKGLLKINEVQNQVLSDFIDNLDLYPFYKKMGVCNEFVTYEECKKWAIDNKISGEQQWRQARKDMPENLPANPERTYRNNGWVNWPTFLENGQRSKKEKWASYEEASAWAQDNKIKSAREWYRLGEKRPSNMPTTPEMTYKKQWVNWPEFLKNGKKPHGSFVSYDEASAWAKQNGIIKGAQWYALKNKPENIPSYPNNVYIEQWVGWAAFLGVEPYRGQKPVKKKIRKRVTERKFNFVSYTECQNWARENNVTTGKQWKKIKDIRPANIPSDPPLAYKNEWRGWPEFFKV